MGKELNTTLGGLIKRYRRNLKMNLEKSSKDLGISIAYLSQIERGKRVPSLDLTKEIRKLFNIPVQDIAMSYIETAKSITIPTKKIVRDDQLTFIETFLKKILV